MQIIYDTANRLAQEIRESEEYTNYKMAKETINLNIELKNRIQEFQKLQYDIQIKEMETGKKDEENLKKAQDLYSELIEREEAKKFFDAEYKFNILLGDVNKIISEAVRDIL